MVRVALAQLGLHAMQIPAGVRTCKHRTTHTACACSVLYDMYYIDLLDLSNNPLRPVDLDAHRLYNEQCFYQPATDMVWLFMGKEPSFGTVGGRLAALLCVG